MKRGFSLVELSIVLVILGLLTGGILAGQSLIRASELRAVSTEANRWTTAMQTFRDKYFALPGDFAKATDFWLPLNVVDATCKTTPATDARTCNGNGDGMVTSTAPAADERFRLWQHLANAGLIEGSYTGVLVNYGANEMPASKLGGGAWFISWNGKQSPTVNWFGADYGNGLQLISRTPPHNIISPEEAWNIDMKMDDGLPGTGKVIAWKGDATHACTSVANNIADAGATYVLTNPAKDCWMHFTRAM